MVSAPAPEARPALSMVDAATKDDAAVPVKEYFTAGELLATTGLRPEEFNQIQALGLVSPVVVDDETVYGAFDVRVAAHSRALLARGVDARHLGSLRRVAQREVGVVDEATFPLRQTGSSYTPEQVLAITSDVAREVAALRSVLVERELNTFLRA